MYSNGKEDSNLLIAKGASLILNLPEKNFLCSRGHKFKNSASWECSVADDPESRTGPLCPYCYVDWMAEMFPTKEV